MLILKIWMFQGTALISSDFYLTFCLGKVEALCFSLITLALIRIILYTNKRCNEAICKSSLGKGNFISWRISKCQGPFSEIAQSFLKFLWDGKNRNCSIWRALAGSHQPDKDSDFESELAYFKEHRKKKKRGWSSCEIQGSTFLRTAISMMVFFMIFFKSPTGF